MPRIAVRPVLRSLGLRPPIIELANASFSVTLLLLSIHGAFLSRKLTNLETPASGKSLSFSKELLKFLPLDDRYHAPPVICVTDANSGIEDKHCIRLDWTDQRTEKANQEGRTSEGFPGSGTLTGTTHFIRFHIDLYQIIPDHLTDSLQRSRTPNPRE